jgi:hypothetical protein
MNTLKIILLILILPFLDIFALDTLTTKYFPLHVGDYWVYNYHSWGYSYNTTYRVKASVVQSFIKENHIYYSIINHPVDYLNNMFTRVDSISGGLVKYDSLNTCGYYYKEDLVDSLSAGLNQYIYFCHPNYVRKLCSQIDTLNIFGQYHERKKFSWGFLIGSHSISWSSSFTKDFGLTNYTYNDIYIYSSGVTVTLIGCKINGVIFGDTSLTQIIGVSSSIPDKSELYQNYPNPFNPSTNIKYKTSNNKFITIKIFDILGKEITTLVNEKKNAGEYEVEFDGSNMPSGMYFYCLLINGLRVDTKRMVMIK